MAKNEEISQLVWRDRIVRPSAEHGDVFFALLYWRTQNDVGEVERLVERLTSSPNWEFKQFQNGNEFGPFKARNPRLCMQSIRSFMESFDQHLRRHNRPGFAALPPAPTEEEMAADLLQTGCAKLGYTFPEFQNFNPWLQWAISNQLGLPSCDR